MKTKPTREDLYALVWEKGITLVAKDLKMSAYELRQLCRELHVPFPDNKYWTRIRLGKNPTKDPLPELPKEVDPPAGLPKGMQFEKRKELVEKKEAVTDYTVPKTLRATDPLIIDTREWIRQNDSTWESRSPFKSEIKNHLDIYVSKKSVTRALLIFQTVIRCLRKRGHNVVCKDYDRYNIGGTLAVIRNEEIQISLREKSKRVENTDDKFSKYSYIDSGNLEFLIYGRCSYQKNSISDTQYSKLEDKIEQIVFKLEAKADEIISEREEAKRREEERRRKEEEERLRKEEEERIRKAIEERRAKEREALQALIFQAKRYTMAKEMRAYLLEVIEKNDGRIPELSEEYSLEWAYEKIDWIDPFRSDNEDLLSLDDLKAILEMQNKDADSDSKQSKTARFHQPW